MHATSIISVHTTELVTQQLDKLSIIYYRYSSGHVCYSLSCVLVFATPWTVARQAPLSMKFSRQEYWSELSISFCRGSSWPTDQTWVSHTAVKFFTNREVNPHVRAKRWSQQSTCRGSRWSSPALPCMGKPSLCPHLLTPGPQCPSPNWWWPARCCSTAPTCSQVAQHFLLKGYQFGNQERTSPPILPFLTLVKSRQQL